LARGMQVISRLLLLLLPGGAGVGRAGSVYNPRGLALLPPAGVGALSFLPLPHGCPSSRRTKTVLRCWRSTTSKSVFLLRSPSADLETALVELSAHLFVSATRDRARYGLLNRVLRNSEAGCKSDIHSAIRC